jgi:SMI1/KNR4 family protein SUKH-1
MSSNERLATAIGQITRWMIEHDAPLLVDNLAGGATTAELANAEAAFGFRLPSDLRDLWSLHHGQNEEMNGFVESLDLFDSDLALAERDSVSMFIGFLRDSPDEWDEAGVSADEIRSDRWIAFAGRDSDLMLVSGVSGRVFTCGKDAPPLQLVAGSVVEWAEQYAARVAANDYVVEDGFGDYYLALRDRDAERRDQEREERERYRRETPSLTQLGDALTRRDENHCRDVFQRAAGESPEVLAQCVELLFGATTDARLIAAALRLALNVVKLTPARWEVVAKGGALLENNAIRNFALARLGLG